MKKMKRKPSYFIGKIDKEDAIKKVYGRKDSVKGRRNFYMFNYRQHKT